MADLYNAKSSKEETSTGVEKVVVTSDNTPSSTNSSQAKEIVKEGKPLIPGRVSMAKIRDFLPGKSGMSLSSWIVLPSDKVKFEVQEPDEKILMILRRHWVTNIPWFITAVVLFLAPRILAFFPLLDSFPVKYQTIFVLIWYLVAAMFVYERFLVWFFNMSIITDERIIDIDFINLTTKKISDADLDKIQDVSFTNTGAVGAIFNFGDVMVQTAAETVEFIFDDVPNPAGVAKILQRLRTEEKIEAIEGRVS